jgi:hypothetical protein
MTRRSPPARPWSSFRTADGAGILIVAESSPGMASRFALRECAHSNSFSSLRKQEPILRACGASSMPWPIASIIRVSGILDRPPSRAMTVSGHSGAMRSIEPGISRFRVWSFGPSRNDGVSLSVASLHKAESVARFYSRHEFAIPRRDAPELCKNPSRPKRAWGMPDARCTRGLVCNGIGGTHTSNNESTGITRHSRTQWF